MYPFYLPYSQRTAGTHERAVLVYRVPIDLGIQAVCRDRTDLQHIEYLRVALHIDGKLDLHRAFDLFLRHQEQLLDDIRQGEGIEFQLRGEGDDTRSVRIARIDDTHVLAVIGRSDHLEAFKLVALMNGETLQVDGIVNGGFEFLGVKREREHGLLGLTHSQIDRGGLEYILRVFGREAQHLFAIYHHFAQTVRHLDDAVFGFLFAHRIEIDAARHTGDDGEEIVALLFAADLLQHDRHLLLAKHIAGRGDITSRRRVIHRGIDRFDGLG